MKRKTSLRIVALFLSVLMLPLVGLGSLITAEEDADLYPLGEEPLEFTFYGHYDWYTMPNWGEDAATGWIKDELQVNITPVSSGGDAARKMATMITGGDLPDVIWCERGADVERLREAGMLVPLDDYIEKYPNFKEWCGESTLNLLRSEDGHIYQLPNWYTLQPNGNTGYAVNKKIYEELGEPALETTEDLYNYLVMVKENYPDVVPFETADGGSGAIILNSAFGEGYYEIAGAARQNGDELISIFEDQAFRDGTKFAAKLFREQLMTQDAFTQTREQVKEKIMNGQVAVYLDWSPTEFCGEAHEVLKAEDPDAGYIMVWPIHHESIDVEKVTPGSFNQLGWNVCLITQQAEDPEAIFAYLDWLTGPEGQSTIQWGPRGGFWDGFDEDGLTTYTEDYVTRAKDLAELTATSENCNWVGNTVFVDRSKSKFEMELPPEQRNWQTQWQSQITWKTQKNVTEFLNLDPLPESAEGIAQQGIGDVLLEARAKAISTAQTNEEVDAILDQAAEDAEVMGMPMLLEFLQGRWEENKAQMAGE